MLFKLFSNCVGGELMCGHWELVSLGQWDFGRASGKYSRASEIFNRCLRPIG